MWWSLATCPAHFHLLRDACCAALLSMEWGMEDFVSGGDAQEFPYYLLSVWVVVFFLLVTKSDWHIEEFSRIRRLLTSNFQVWKRKWTNIQLVLVYAWLEFSTTISIVVTGFLERNYLYKPIWSENSSSATSKTSHVSNRTISKHHVLNHETISSETYS